MTDSYCLLSLKKSHVSHHIIFITACAQNVGIQHERKRVEVDAKANSTFDNRVTQSGPLADSYYYYYYYYYYYERKITSNA